MTENPKRTVTIKKSQLGVLQQNGVLEINEQLLKAVPVKPGDTVFVSHPDAEGVRAKVVETPNGLAFEAML